MWGFGDMRRRYSYLKKNNSDVRQTLKQKKTSGQMLQELGMKGRQKEK
jgi:hypothetical protein